MMSKVELRKKIGENSGDVKLLSEIETISKALYLEKNPSKTSISAPGNRSKPTRKSQLLDPKSKIIDGNEDSSQKDKKSFWNWKPLKALSNVRNRKFNCCFSLLVHSIEGFPSSFENLSICVHWKRRDGELVTRPVKELDLGKHRVDLTKLLPLTLVELEDEKSSGKWTTSFKLSGEAKGAMMNVSFGYTVVGDSQIPLGNNQNVPELFNLKQNNAKTVKPVPKFGQGDRKSTIRHTEGNASNKDELMVHDCNIKEDEICSKEYVMKELEAALSNVTNLETQAFYSPEQKENYMEIKTDYESNRNKSSLSLDDVTESVANDFLDMLGIELSPLVLSSESEPESPRERLLRQFEKDALAGGYSMFDFGVDIEDQIECDHNTSTVSEWGNFSEDFDLLSVIQDPEEQMRTQAESGKTRAKVLEDLETETLMREWGLSDEAFQHSPPENSGGFGSPIDCPLKSHLNCHLLEKDWVHFCRQTMVDFCGL
ncbi:hypothetical protein GH714_038622 [Hevea brasiliensis]|uniref:C2 NT-type domain-containing protein n=1 Tax=Hevea brasiliensis TaxID=3981 RepID=A0A6A6KE12_HEVBR|nr:hypothetical protein GH714_038622 [Hevea brasiliensis]